MKDTAAIPKGNFCYRLVPRRPGEMLSGNTDRSGQDQREYPYGEHFKEVLCPYWQRTDYGMIQCDYLKVESLDEDDSGARDKAIRHFGSEELFESANTRSHLYVEIKICDIRLDEDGEREHPAA